MAGSILGRLFGVGGGLEITPRDAKTLLDSPQPPRLIDVRGADEFAICRIEGAELIPLDQLAQHFPARFSDPAQPIVLYCHHGMRSMNAAKFLAARGCTAVRSMGGGIDAWSVGIDPTVPRY
jgi:rhodanese-related sulfurtransferase